MPVMCADMCAYLHYSLAGRQLVFFTLRRKARGASVRL
jgi:hypothetical protein